MINSVTITPADPGSGVKVNIENYEGDNNITEVTTQQYAMVAQIAGVTCNYCCPTSGKFALAGVYKALATDEVNLNT